MNLIILLTVLGLIIGFLRGTKYSDRSIIRLNMFFQSLGGLIIGAVSGFLVTLILSLFVKHDRVPVKVDRVDIHAMSDGSSLSGSFFLGSGSIDGREYYYYYETLDNGGFKQRKVPVDIAIIFEHADIENGRVEMFNTVLPDDHWAVGWAFRGCNCANDLNLYKLYEFHIPKGSIKHKLDLE